MHIETRRLKREFRKTVYSTYLETDTEGNQKKVRIRINDISLKRYARSTNWAQANPSSWFARKRVS